MSTALSINSESSGLGSVYAVADGGSAVSATANVLRLVANDAANAVERSQALFGSKARVIEDIWCLAHECSRRGWDGYDAEVVSREAIRRAIALVRALPDDVPLPEVGPEPDGTVALEWSRSKHAVLSLSVGVENGLAYAWLDHADRGHAVAVYEEGRFPHHVLQRIRSIMEA